MRTEESRPDVSPDGDEKTNADSISTASLPPVVDSQGRRYDFWDLALLDAITDPDPHVSTEAHEEMDRRWEVATDLWAELDLEMWDKSLSEADRYRYNYENVPGRGYQDEEGNWWITDDDHPQGDPGGITGDALGDRMGDVAGDLETVLLIMAARRWFDLIGAPYELPEALRGPRRTHLPDYLKESIWEAWISEERLHDLDGHEAEPSLACSECTPHPALGFRYVESLSIPELKALAAKNEQRAEQIERDATAGVVSLDDLLAMAAAPLSLHADLVPEKGVTILVGRRSTLKTFGGVYVGLSVLSKDPAASVLFVAGEGVQSIGARIAAGAQHLGLSHGRVNRGLLITTVVPDLFARDAAYEELLQRCKDQRPALVVLDHLGLVSGDAVQDRADHMSRVGRSLADLAKASGGAVLVLAHLGKGDTSRGVRGSSAIEDQADAILVTERRGHTLRLRVTKMRDAADGAVKQFRAVEHLGSLVLQPVDVDPTAEPDEPEDDTPESEGDAVARQVFDVLKASSSPLSTGQIRKAIEAAEGDAPGLSTIRERIAGLRDSGVVVKPEGAASAVYTLAQGQS